MNGVRVRSTVYTVYSVQCSTVGVVQRRVPLTWGPMCGWQERLPTAPGREAVTGIEAPTTSLIVTYLECYHCGGTVSLKFHRVISSLSTFLSTLTRSLPALALGLSTQRVREANTPCWLVL